MWIRLIDNSTAESKVFEYKEGVLSTCDYRIHPNGRVGISLVKEGYSPDSNLESAMLVLMQKDFFDVELYSGTTIIKAVKCKVNNYNMSSGDAGNLKERADLLVLTEGIDYNFVSPLLAEAIYDTDNARITFRAENLIQEESGAFFFDPTRISVFGVSLSDSSNVVVAQKKGFTIALSEDDFKKIEEARLLGAHPYVKAVAGWNSRRSNTTEVSIIVPKTNSKIQVVEGSTEGLSN